MILGLFVGGKAYAQENFAVRNNFIYDISGTLNLGADVRVSPHWTMGLNAGYRPWPTDDKTTRKWKHFLIAPELRYWTDSTFHRSYWGTNVFYSHYNVGHVTFPFGLYKTVRDHRIQGDLIGLGAFYGRSWRLNRYFRLEGELGLGIGYTWAKKYECAHCGAYEGKHNKPFLIPKLTLNVVYQKANALSDVGGKSLIVDVGSLLCAEAFAGSQHEFVAGLKDNALGVFKLSEANFGALRIEQGCNRQIELASYPFQHLKAREMPRVISVAEIESRNVHTGEYHAFKGLFVIGGGTERADDFGFSHEGASLSF